MQAFSLSSHQTAGPPSSPQPITHPLLQLFHYSACHHLMYHVCVSFLKNVKVCEILDLFCLIHCEYLQHLEQYLAFSKCLLKEVGIGYIFGWMNVCSPIKLTLFVGICNILIWLAVIWAHFFVMAYQTLLSPADAFLCPAFVLSLCLRIRRCLQRKARYHLIFFLWLQLGLRQGLLRHCPLMLLTG